MKRHWKIAAWLISFLVIAAILVLASGFFAVRFGWTKVEGESDPNSALYNAEAAAVPDTAPEVAMPSLPRNTSIYGENEGAAWCKIALAADLSPYNASSILRAFRTTRSETLLRRMLLALSFRSGNQSAFLKKLADCEKPGAVAPSLAALSERLASPQGANLYSWQNYEPWSIIRRGLLKDKPAIERAAAAAGVQPRLLVSVVIVEQLRLYYTQRELFEKIFKPLEILANANKMAWGVMSIKEKMAMETESHLHDSRSPYYLGNKASGLLDFPAGSDKSRERYHRLTDERDHYYSYLYGALILRQFESQWEKAGYSISYRPEVVATLFNIGFNNSHPKKDPAVGGSTIHINGEKYFFGSLAYEFYYSGDLIEEFPFK